jgi:hypothetical protein
MAAGVNQGLLIRKGLLLAKVETVAGTDALPVASLDAIQAFDAEFSVDPNILEREVLTGDLSPVEHIIGRKLASLSFSVELKSNGLFSGDVVTDEPKLARLLRGCGYSLSGRPDRAEGFTTDFATNNDLTMPSQIIGTAPTADGDHGMQTGDGSVQVYANGGTLPTGLTAATDYFIIRKSATAFSLATTRANALAGTEVALSGDAVGAVQVDLLTMSVINTGPDNGATGIVTRINRAKGVAATGTFTLTGQPADTETVVIGAKTYIFQTVLTNVDGNVFIGATASDTLDNLVAAVNLGAGAGTLYAAATVAHPDSTLVQGAGDTVVATALATGTAGNALASTTTVTLGSWGGATYAGGVDPTDNAFTEPVVYTITCSTGGAPGVAQLLISSNNASQDDTTANTPFVAATKAPFELAGATGSNLSVIFDYNEEDGTAPVTLVQGDTWRILVHPDGTVASPVSENFSCLTLKFYEDGLLYTTLGSQGTFTVDATAGNFGTLEFTFTGQYIDPSDAAVPTDAVFENTLPQQVELGLLTWGSNVQLVAEQWTFDQANNVVPRPDINATDGFQGVRITDRTPAGGFNPEATLVATEDFWGDFAAALAKVFTARVGTTVGNQVFLYAPRVQTSEIAFGDRDGVRSFDHSMLFKRLDGNDESDWYFT